MKKTVEIFIQWTNASPVSRRAPRRGEEEEDDDIPEAASHPPGAKGPDDVFP